MECIDAKINVNAKMNRCNRQHSFVLSVTVRIDQARVTIIMADQKENDENCLRARRIGAEVALVFALVFQAFTFKVTLECCDCITDLVYWSLAIVAFSLYGLSLSLMFISEAVHIVLSLDCVKVIEPLEKDMEDEADWQRHNFMNSVILAGSTTVFFILRTVKVVLHQDYCQFCNGLGFTIGIHVGAVISLYAAALIFFYIWRKFLQKREVDNSFRSI